MRRATADDDMVALARLIQLSDSALPIGAFSFSAALETAAAEHLVTDADSLSRYVQAVVHQSMKSDGVAMLSSYRYARMSDGYDSILRADRYVVMFRMNEESRRMTCRMGLRMAELGALLTGNHTVERWNGDVRAGNTPGSHPVALALVAAAMGLSEQMLFTSHLYGVASMVTNAALRCVKLSHYDTQRIVSDVLSESVKSFHEVASMSLSDMNSFAPELDILSSMHEVGSNRMFMS